MGSGSNDGISGGKSSSRRRSRHPKQQRSSPAAARSQEFPIAAINHPPPLPNCAFDGFLHGNVARIRGRDLNSERQHPRTERHGTFHLGAIRGFYCTFQTQIGQIPRPVCPGERLFSPPRDRNPRYSLATSSCSFFRVFWKKGGGLQKSSTRWRRGSESRRAWRCSGTCRALLCASFSRFSVISGSFCDKNKIISILQRAGG